MGLRWRLLPARLTGLALAGRLAAGVGELPGLLASADLAISSTGYNTAAEVETAGVRAIFVPAPRSHDDQYARAERRARQHSHFRVFRGATTSALAALMHESLASPPPRRAAPPDGGYRAAQFLIDLLHARER